MNVGIIGAGQLARMLALAGYPLGLKFAFLDPAPDACAASLGEHLCGNYDDPELLAKLAAGADVLTYEFENVPDKSVVSLSGFATVHPNAGALATARDRAAEKALFSDLGIPVPPHALVDTRADLDRAVAAIGLPAVLKTRTLGYDGKGQAVLRNASEVEAAWAQLGGAHLILEGFVSFDREVSVIAVRGRNKETRFYPLAENTHRDGVLRLSVSVAGDAMQKTAEQYAARLLDRLDYVGVIALELFQRGDTLLANEMAPRVHNSGHWTIEGAQTSQFENHLRAILGLPLGATDALGCAAMVNFIGSMPDSAAVLAIPGAHLHDYGKQARAGRKLGHATLRADNRRELRCGLDQLISLARASE
jgi:5-(carboxyamino)imidazole ribonucleotide synthase